MLYIYIYIYTMRHVSFLYVPCAIERHTHFWAYTASNTQYNQILGHHGTPDPFSIKRSKFSSVIIFNQHMHKTKYLGNITSASVPAT